jgi:molybdopterin-guanine dinucleotide biosynthesis protein A
MSSFDAESLALIPGDTPKEKHENMKKIMEIINGLVSPRRGTDEESNCVYYFANKAAEIINPVK